MPPSASLQQETDKAKKVAIDNIILYLKDRDNKIALKRSYKEKEACEFLDSINNNVLPNKKLKITQKPIEKLLPAKSFFLERVSKETQGYFQIVLKAVRCNGLELQFASEEMKNDYMIVRAAVRQNGFAIRYANEQ